MLIRCFKEENPEAVVNFLRKLYNADSIGDRLLLLRGAVSAGEDGFGVLNVLRRYCTPEELAVLGKRYGRTE